MDMQHGPAGEYWLGGIDRCLLETTGTDLLASGNGGGRQNSGIDGSWTFPVVEEVK
jgi:hypothetical protein